MKFKIENRKYSIHIDDEGKWYGLCRFNILDSSFQRLVTTNKFEHLFDTKEEVEMAILELMLE